MVPVEQALRDGAARLAAAGIDSPRREARLLLAKALDLMPAGLLERRTVPTEIFDILVARRAAREPLALITGHREFWSLDFSVSSDTLVPRSDSEALVEAMLAAVPTRDAALRLLDLGTGTGCLLLAALHELPLAFGIGVDRISGAVTLARNNAEALGLVQRAVFLCADWATALTGPFDVVLCNPPYIRLSEIMTLMPEVALHEPTTALSGGSDGLDAYRAIVPSLPALLAPGAVAVLELGRDQAPEVAALAEAHGFATTRYPDLAGIERALILRSCR
jgi:release factor glutamine methyltransferase